MSKEIDRRRQEIRKEFCKIDEFRMGLKSKSFNDPETIEYAKKILTKHDFDMFIKDLEEDSKQDDTDATRKQVGPDAEILGGGDENGNFTYFTGRKLNREQRRDSMKHDERWVVSRIHIEFENGKAVDLDIDKVMIVDKDTKAQLFDYVVEGKAK